jgi:hypothetical protein
MRFQIVFNWLGCRDSNPGMLVSETRALPLGDTPINGVTNYLEYGWGAGIRTPECWYQKPEPYRLATPQKFGGYDGI